MPAIGGNPAAQCPRQQEAPLPKTRSLDYDRLVETALRGVVREVLTVAARDGLPGSHHFYVSFRTRHPQVRIGDFLRNRYPEEMTIVLQHQFWDLQVREDGFGVTLSFNDKPERLSIPFSALTAFVDPSAQFALRFRPDADAVPALAPVPDAAGDDAATMTEAPGEAGHGAKGEPAPRKPRSRRKPDARGAADKADAEAKRRGESPGADDERKDKAADETEKVVTLDAFRKK